jgi:hypothetical protein
MRGHLRKIKPRGAPSLAFETWDPRPIPNGNPTRLPTSKRKTSITTMLRGANGLKTTIPGLCQRAILSLQIGYAARLTDASCGVRASFWESPLYALFQAKSIFFRSLSPFYFPMQKVEKIKFRMSSLVVSPVSESRWRRAPYRSSSTISCGIFCPAAAPAAARPSSVAVTA